MKIRKFFAGSSREALRLVREALGPDAVVLSNRAVDGGVELVALAENDLATLAHPGLSAEPLHDSAGLAQGAPMASAARAAPMSQAQPLSYAQVPSRGAAALPDPFASTFGAPAASVDHPAHYASGAAAPRSPSRPTWDDQHTAGAAASYDGRSQAPPPRRPAEANQAVDHVVERAVERSMRQQSERIAAWRAESAAAQNSGYDAQADTRQAARSGQPTDSRQDSRQEARQDAHGDTRHGARQEHQPNSHQDARGEWPSARRSQAAQPVPAQFTPQAPQPHDQIVHAAPAPLTPAGAMARKLGAPATALPSDAHSHAPSQATHGRHGERHTAQRDNGASAVSPAAQTLPFAEPVTAAARTVSARQEVAMTLPDSAAAFAVPPVRSYPALAALPQPAYAMRTTVNASMASRFPAQVTPAPVVAASLPEPLGTSAGAAPPMTAATAAAATASSVAAATPLPAAATPASPSPEMPVSAAASGATSDDFDGLHDLAAQLAAQPAEQAEQAQARVAELVAQSVIGEIHSMRGVIEEQLAGLLWSDRQRRDPARGQAAKTLLAAGFSSQLVKLLIERMPTQLDHAQAMDWLKAALGRNLPVLQNEDALLERGGVYALMGPTGVGKTTTTAKLAARCVMRYGANRVALLTTDSYRIGAHEQLRIYGKILGVGVHAVKDAADLRLALSELRNKHMVLIDTIGMSQRDRTVSEQVAMLCGTGTPVQRLLLLNATSHGDTLNEVVHAYRNRQAAEGADLAGCILTKLDEATNIGAVLDTVIRYRLPVHYVSTGQKVPENLYVARKDFLIESAFAVPRESSPFAPAEDELAAMMAAVPTHAATDVSEVRLG